MSLEESQLEQELRRLRQRGLRLATLDSAPEFTQLLADYRDRTGGGDTDISAMISEALATYSDHPHHQTVLELFSLHSTTRGLPPKDARRTACRRIRGSTSPSEIDAFRKNEEGHAIALLAIALNELQLDEASRQTQEEGNVAAHSGTGSAPMYSETGFLTPSTVLERARTASRFLRLTGLSHRLYADNSDLLNIVLGKLDANPNFRLFLIFVHPHSPTIELAAQVARRRPQSLGSEVLDHLSRATKTFREIRTRVDLLCALHPMAVPAVEYDDHVDFSISAPSVTDSSGRRVGVVGGPFFTADIRSPLGAAVTRELDAIPVARLDTEHEVEADEVLERLVPIDGFSRPEAADG